MDNTKVSNSLDFPLYGTYVSVILSDTKMLINNSQSTIRKFVGTIITGLFLTLGVILIISEMLDIKNCYDISTFALRMNPICYHLCGIVKWIHSLMKINESEEVIRRLKRCHLIALKLNQSDKDDYYYRMKVMKSQRISSKFSRAYMTLLIYGTIQWCMNPIFYDLANDFYGAKEINSTFSRHLPYPGIIPWEVDNIHKYICTFALQAIASLGTGIAHAIYEVMYFTILVWACSHLEYLAEVLTDLRDNQMILNDDSAIQKFRNKLRQCAIHHREILEFFDNLTDIMSIPVFTICSQGTIALCLVSLEISTMKIDSSVESIMIITSLFEYWVGLNIQLSLYCYFGTKIQHLGLNIADATYMCDWEHVVNLNQNEHKNADDDNQEAIININQMIQFSLMRAQKPIVLKGGLFYTLSLETYKALTGFSLSNAVVLSQVSSRE